MQTEKWKNNKFWSREKKVKQSRDSNEGIVSDLIKV